MNRLMHEVHIVSTKNQTSSIGRSHGVAIGLISLAMLHRWRCKDFKSLIHLPYISLAHLGLRLGGKVGGG